MSWYCFLFFNENFHFIFKCFFPFYSHFNFTRCKSNILPKDATTATRKIFVHNAFSYFNTSFQWIVYEYFLEKNMLVTLRIAQIICFYTFLLYIVCHVPCALCVRYYSPPPPPTPPHTHEHTILISSNLIACMVYRKNLL